MDFENQTTFKEFTTSIDTLNLDKEKASKKLQPNNIKQIKFKQRKYPKRARKSEFWSYFKNYSELNKTARCRLCDAKLSFKGTISNLKKHLSNKHSLNIHHNQEILGKQKSETHIPCSLDVKSSSMENSNNDCPSTSSHKKSTISEIKTEKDTANERKHSNNIKKPTTKEIYPTRLQATEFWNYFKERSRLNKTAKCKICNTKLSFRGNPANLKTHLQKQHSINLQSPKSKQVKQKPSFSSPHSTDIKTFTTGNINNDESSACTSISKDPILVQGSIPNAAASDQEKANNIEGTEPKQENCKPLRAAKFWTYFKERSKQNKTARCKLCEAKLSFRTTISNLKKHLLKKHAINVPPVLVPSNHVNKNLEKDFSSPPAVDIKPCSLLKIEKEELSVISNTEDEGVTPAKSEITNKDLPALTCVDLFPDPPRMIAQSDEPHHEGSIADEDEFAGFKVSENHIQANRDEIKDEPGVSSNPLVHNNPSDEIIPVPESPKNEPHFEDLPKPTTVTNTSIASAPVSPASYFSSAESIASSASSSKKSKKRYCRRCDKHFRKTRELHEHLKTHISLPDIRVEKLSDDNDKVKEYLCSLSPKPSPTHGSLKLKFKLLDSQNFEVVSSEKSEKPLEEESRIRILKAADIRCKPELEERAPIEPYPQEAKLQNSFLQPENRYFECPTFDGLDNFDDMLHTGEATEDLLKKLLENNKEPQSFPKEADWPANANEFISIDSLAPRCNVCHMNFSHPKYLYEHKQITGHDFQPRMTEPIPTSQPNYIHHPQNNFMHATHPPPQNMPPLYQMAQMRGNFPGYGHGPRLNVRQMMHNHPQPSPPPGFHPSQCMMTRTPPPLYRVNSNPPNFPPTRYLEKRPEMYGPAPPPPQFVNGNQQVNQEMMRQPIFLKSRLQKAIRGRSQGPTNEIPTSPGILTQQTAIRPRFLGPTPQMPGHMQFQRAHVQTQPKQGEPPMKKVKLEPQNRFSSPSPNGISHSPGISNSPGMPIIQSVHGGVNASNFPQLAEKPKEGPSSGAEQTSPTAKGTIKNPKDVANILATRGITVTHRGKTSFVPLSNKGSNSANASAQEAVQKLQANNSVSIISKKKPTEMHVKGAPPGPDGSGHRITTKFLSCPVITCKEKFLTVEGVNRHAFRWHGIPMPNPDRVQKRILRCRLCHHICSSPEILQEHIRREHEPSVNEIGIPIVDLRNDEVKRKLAGLGIFNYVPLTAAGASTSSLAFPVVSVQGAANPSICNLLGLGASSVLSLGPVKSITVRKPNNENK